MASIMLVCTVNPILQADPLRTLAVAVLVLCLLAWPAAGAAEEPGFVVRTAFTDLVDGTYRLYADIDYGLGEHAIEALENGVPLTFEVTVLVVRLRPWRWNKTVEEVNQQYMMVYHPLADRFVVRNLNTGNQTSYMSFRAAATELGRISDMHIIADERLREGEHYQARMRVRLVVEALPGPMRWFEFMFPRWSEASEWYAWTLRS